jgi:hypothetical protein
MACIIIWDLRDGTRRLVQLDAWMRFSKERMSREQRRIRCARSLSSRFLSETSGSGRPRHRALRLTGVRNGRGFEHGEVIDSTQMHNLSSFIVCSRPPNGVGMQQFLDGGRGVCNFSWTQACGHCVGQRDAHIRKVWMRAQGLHGLLCLRVHVRTVCEKDVIFWRGGLKKNGGRLTSPFEDGSRLGARLPRVGCRNALGSAAGRSSTAPALSSIDAVSRVALFFFGGFVVGGRGKGFHF